MHEAPPSEEQNGRRAWSIYDGTYDPVSNPADPAVLEQLANMPQEKHMQEAARKRILTVHTAVYALCLCNPEVASDPELNDRVQRKVASGIMQFSLHSFSEVDTKTRAQVASLELDEPPVFAVLADMEQRKMINSYDCRMIEDAFRMMMIEEKKSYDLAVIDEVFGVVLSGLKKAPGSTEEHVK